MSDIIWGITEEDLQMVARDYLNRELDEEELEHFQRKFEIDWWEEVTAHFDVWGYEHGEKEEKEDLWEI